MNLPTEDIVPSTVADCMGITLDSSDSFYSMSDSCSSQQVKPFSNYSTSSDQSQLQADNCDMSNDLSMDSWLAAEGIIDVQQVLLNEHSAAPNAVPDTDSLFGSVSVESMFDAVGSSNANTDLYDSMSESEEEVENDSSAERMEVKLVMSLPSKSLSSEQKKIRRRELNRLAAQRSRGKKRAATKALGQEVKDLAVKNKELKAALEKLLKEKELYLRAVKQHFRCYTQQPTNHHMFHTTTPTQQGVTTVSNDGV